MIEIKRYQNREEALERIMKKDKEYTFVRHDFNQGKIIEAHHHPVNEWVIVDSGRCEVTLGLETLLVEPKEEALVIYFAKKGKHGLKCLTDISYWVLRDRT